MQTGRYILSLLMIYQLWIYPASGQEQHSDTLVLRFAFARSTLHQEDIPRIRIFLQKLKATDDSLMVVGYTDIVGTSSYNLGLSFSRGTAVAGYIKRISLLPYTVIGRGKQDPIDGNDSLSRRVLIIACRPVLNQGIIPPKIGSQPSTISVARGQSKFFIPDNLPPDTIISLANINFVEDSPNLTESSRMALPSTLRVLKKYKTDLLEIDGYCNSTTPITSSSDPLFQLSVKRARLIFDYLLDEGFDSTRVSYKGMGNASPLSVNPTTNEEARANMRVEIRVYKSEKMP